MARISWASWRPLGPITDEPPIRPTVLVFHTMAGFLRGTDAHFRRGGFDGVESTFGVGGPADGALDGALWQWQDMHRQADAQSAGNAYANSVETSDGTFSNHPWSTKQIRTLVRLVVDWCRLTGNPCRVVRAANERGLGWHGQFSIWNPDAHTCPGPVRLGQLRTTVIPRARAILQGSPLAIEHDLGRAGRLAEDGVVGTATIATLQRELGIADDGVLGPETRVALQQALGVRPDSAVGPVTVAALQARIGVDETGVWDDRTSRALQRALNEGGVVTARRSRAEAGVAASPV